MIKYHKEDIIPRLLSEEFEVFAHGCNCFCTMGAGIASSIKKNFPEVYSEDCKTNYGDKNKLGTIIPVEVRPHKIIINAYTQYDYRGVVPNVNYDAITSCFKRINTFMYDSNFSSLIIPKIGAGLAGGNWNIIENIIKETISDAIDLEIYYL